MNSIIGVIAIIAVTILLNIILDYFILDRDNDKDNSDLISIIKNKKKGRKIWKREKKQQVLQ